MRFPRFVVAIAFALFHVSNGVQPLEGEPYSIGLISQCAKPPETTHCSFPADYTVPISIAKRIESIDGQIKLYHEQFRAVDSVGCADAFVGLMCDYLVQPRCIGSETVQFKSNFRQNCNAALTTGCTNAALIAQLSASLCNNPTMDVTGTFSRTTCAVPSIAACDNTDPSPAWVNRYAELTLQLVELPGFSSDCAALYMRMKCSLPTCGANNTLLRVTRRETCEDVVECAPQAQRAATRQQLACDEFPSTSGASVPVMWFVIWFSPIFAAYCT